MKTGSIFKWTAGFAGLALMTGTVLAQNAPEYQTEPYGNPNYGNSQGYQRSNQTYSGATRQGNQKGQFCDAKRLMRREVKDPQGKDLGHIKDIAFNQKGEIFAVIGVGSGKDAMVPIQTLKITSTKGHPQVTLNTTKQDLQSGPVALKDKWLQALNTPGFAHQVYSHYNLQVQGSPEVGVVTVQPVLPQER